MTQSTGRFLLVVTGIGASILFTQPLGLWLTFLICGFALALPNEAGSNNVRS